MKLQYEPKLNINWVLIDTTREQFIERKIQLRPKKYHNYSGITNQVNAFVLGF